MKILRLEKDKINVNGKDIEINISNLKNKNFTSIAQLLPIEKLKQLEQMLKDMAGKAVVCDFLILSSPLLSFITIMEFVHEKYQTETEIGNIIVNNSRI